ncbi:1-deoxy-D-xylulose 5-phosphate reductoisomerase [Stackebrandtia endophytica]|uniref:1-deoxy-D-xylulose 5-phosphate reductoisomerase n=1 Tax=Stackebrandtia endophytica TaxID=1496996 RepID=A0A543B1K5_9ACTN|nr:1-deoxy-D-xylulose-5-phosphate reductoisomerase [Stackebrandtia endophytica]TQL78728.1 1-deoxy-D-xylulose 5-phosphate reductoisomerase [Stackebrandtia endophytica]
MNQREIVILGSTGSIGTQAIDVVDRNPDALKVVGIGAGGGNIDLLAEQALALEVAVVAVAKASAAADLQLAFYAAAQRQGYSQGQFRIPKILAGPHAMTELAAWNCDVVLNGMTGSIGLEPTLAALKAGRVLALANKESLVAGGPLVRAVAQPGQIVPVDSEHSALAQCLRGGARSEVRRLVLTATGGPFRGRTRAELGEVTLEEALRHPTWSMGPVVTINSATMVNKSLEVIEAYELFDVDYDHIEVMLHPQSYIHSMVEFQDGSTVAQVSPPDMRLAIAQSLVWPDRLPDVAPAVDWTKAATWELFPMDDEAFPAVELARHAGRTGRCLPAVYNAANEECVAAFTQGRLPFLGIVDTLSEVVAQAPDFGTPGTVDDVLEAEAWARDAARDRIAKMER